MNVFSELARPILHRPGDALTRVEQRTERFPPISNPWGLDGRHTTLLQHLIEGCSNDEIAKRMGVAVKTAEMYRTQAFEAMGARNCVQAAVMFDRFITGRQA